MASRKNKTEPFYPINLPKEEYDTLYSLVRGIYLNAKRAAESKPKHARAHAKGVPSKKVK